ncbi:MAG: hypothetical protein M1823_000684 [Watsoniomyces obsoletus]|nr:MAG: hypothetical protein M1823_000684 [Watsoniomyces obsoletus]
MVSSTTPGPQGSMMLLYHRPVPAKTPKRRSRAGCIHCKEKKKKCNEERPQCDRCMERGLKCQYEPVKPRRRRRTTSAVGTESPRAKSVTSDPGPHPGYHTTFSATPIPVGVRAVMADYRAHSTSPSPYIGVWEDDEAELGIGGRGPAFHSPPSGVDDLRLETTFPVMGEYRAGPGCGTPVPSAPGTVTDYPLSSTADSPHPHSAIGYPHSPPTTEYGPGLVHSTSPIQTTMGFSEFHFGRPTSNASPEMMSKSIFMGGSSGMMVDSHRPNRRLLLDHFNNVVSHLAVFTEQPANPLRQYLLPMAGRSLAVMNAVLAVSAAHMEHRGISNEERALDFYAQALQGLALLIADQRTSRDEVLAVIILLIYYEVIRDGSSAVLNSHLRGALSVMRARPAQPSPTSFFLERAFHYFDVLCAISFGTAPTAGSVMPPVSHGIFSPPDLFDAAGVDPVFGFTADMWPLIHRLTKLHEMRKGFDVSAPASPDHSAPTAKRSEFESSCASVELALHQWAPQLLPGALSAADSSPAEDARIQSILSHAEATRHAAMVFLARNVQREPRSSQRVQAPAKHGLQACLRVVVFGGPMAGLLWPLYQTACEALDEVDRNVARTVFRHLESRQGMQNIVHAWQVVEEVWQRQDDGHEMEAETVCIDMNCFPILA